MNNLVLQQNNKIFTTSEILAEGFGIEHYSIKKTILKYQSELESLGPVSVFKNQKLKNTLGGRPEVTYCLNKEQAMLVGSFSQNTEVVVAFKVALIKRFTAMEKQLLEKGYYSLQKTNADLCNTMQNVVEVIKDTKENLVTELTKIYSGNGTTSFIHKKIKPLNSIIALAEDYVELATKQITNTLRLHDLTQLAETVQHETKDIDEWDFGKDEVPEQELETEN